MVALICWGGSCPAGEDTDLGKARIISRMSRRVLDAVVLDEMEYVDDFKVAERFNPIQGAFIPYFAQLDLRDDIPSNHPESPFFRYGPFRSPVSYTWLTSFRLSFLHINFRRFTDHRFKIPDKMRLVVIAHVHGQLQYILLIKAFKHLGGILRPVQANHPFRAYPDVLLEQALK